MVTKKIKADLFAISEELTLFHGTGRAFAQSICDFGVSLREVGENKSVYTDFGPGFYMTESREQAEIYAEDKFHDQAAVVEIHIKMTDLWQLKWRSFGSDTNSYWSIVRYHRHRRPPNGAELGHPYDVITGPVAYDYATHSPRGKVKDGYDQTSFHTELAFQVLNSSKRSWERLVRPYRRRR